MAGHAYIERFVNLLDPGRNLIFNMTVDEAVERLGSGDARQVREIDGQFALVHRRGHIIRMARSIGRPPERWPSPLCCMKATMCACRVRTASAAPSRSDTAC